MAGTMKWMENAITCNQVEQAWLDAGRRGDITTMQSLRKTHPKWLALERVAITSKLNPKYADVGDEAPSFCDWEKFHLPTIGASALHAAAWDGNYDVLEFLLKEGQQVDERGRRGVTALMATLMRHNVQALRAVFQGSAVVQLNTVTDCRKEDAERLNNTLNVVKLLLRHGAKIEARDQEGKTALLLATNDELFEVAKLLLENGACIDAQDIAGRTPLHVCLRTSPEQSVLVTNLLISQGALIDIPDKTGETPLTIVVHNGDTTVLQLLLNHYSLVATSGRQDFPAAVLLQAAELGVVDAVRFLLDSKYTSIDVVNERGETALHLAIVKKHKQVIEMLCAYESAEILLQARTHGKNESVLDYAARYGSLQLVQSLLGKRSSHDINAADTIGSTCCVSQVQPLQLDHQMNGQRLHSSETSMRHGMRLFRAIKTGTGVTLVAINPAARRSLALWMAECSASSPTTLSDFCINWLTCVQHPQTNVNQQRDAIKPSVVTKPGGQTAIKDKRQRVSLIPVVAACVCAGYTVDAVPLLMTLPFKREAMPHFLELLKTFALDTKHALLQKLQLELLAAWKIETRRQESRIG
ncbi:unnamed protein product [Peronospora farinosa]|uniref:Uncharacterized protein n=1 Tax=Peronospora farinosa TaxID=134698 RepID=A0ABN8CE62_9STRA|nr:unnamed protein product [Peronospora farinosa]